MNKNLISGLILAGSLIAVQTVSFAGTDAAMEQSSSASSVAPTGTTSAPAAKTHKKSVKRHKKVTSTTETTTPK